MILPEAMAAAYESDSAEAEAVLVAGAAGTTGIPAISSVDCRGVGLAFGAAAGAVGCGGAGAGGWAATGASAAVSLAAGVNVAANAGPVLAGGA